MTAQIKRKRSTLKKNSSHNKSVATLESNQFVKMRNFQEEQESDICPKWEEMKEELEVDNFIYGIEDEIMSKAMEEIKRKRMAEERIESFVDSFCKAWVKLVRWRWMVKDVVGIDDETDEDEPVTCPEDPWSSHCVVQKSAELWRTSLPPPAKCCSHPPFIEAKVIQVEKPILERIRWENQEFPSLSRRTTERLKLDDTRSIIPGTVNKKEDARVYQQEMMIPKTAFPERATAKITLSIQMSELRKKNYKKYVSEVNLLDKQ